MQATGRRQINAPLSTSTGVVTALANGGGTKKVTSVALVPVATPVPGTDNKIQYAGTADFAVDDVVIVDYYGAQPEVAIVKSVAAGSFLMKDAVGNDYFIKFPHAIGVTVIKKNPAIRPGSVRVVATGDDVEDPTGATFLAVDDGQGNLVDPATGAVTTANGVDYSVGWVNTLAYNAGDCDYGADKMTDDASLIDLNDPTGEGFFNNMQVMKYTGADAPDAARLKNIGDEEVGVFVEVTRDGRNYSYAGVAKKLRPQAFDVTKMVNGQPYKVVRVRAGSAAKVIVLDPAIALLSTSSTDVFAPNGGSSLVDVDTMQGLEYNGQ